MKDLSTSKRNKTRISLKIIFWLLEFLFILTVGLGGVAFLTLLERKILGLRQVRLGPNKTSIRGLIQPVFDGIKLLTKAGLLLIQSFKFFFLFSPGIVLFFFLIIWLCILPWEGQTSGLKCSSLCFFALLGLNAYRIILTGWSSVSRFSKLGGFRSLLQSLRFEVAIILLFIIVLKVFRSLSFRREVKPLELLFFWFILWFILSLIETNRAPFDLVEGERELIRGFNVEIRRLRFIFLFLREYGIILVISVILSLRLSYFYSFQALIYLILLLILLTRSCFPRIRYDIIITIIWGILLPFIITSFRIFSFL